MDQFSWLRDWIIFSFFVDMPPMRPQNAVLEILTSVETLGNRQHNGILFFKNSIQLQIVTFKNSQYIGEKTIIVLPTLEKKLRAYVEVIRPFFSTVKLFIYINNQ